MSAHWHAGWGQCGDQGGGGGREFLPLRSVCSRNRGAQSGKGGGQGTDSRIAFPSTQNMRGMNDDGM